MSVIPDGSARTLHTFITDNVAPGSTVVTDGWFGYLGIVKAGYTHDRRSQCAAKALGEDIGKPLPCVHRVVRRVAALAKRWLLSTHQGAVDLEHPPRYLDESGFRFYPSASWPLRTHAPTGLRAGLVAVSPGCLSAWAPARSTEAGPAGR